MLRCRLNPSIGFVIAGHQSMECQFTQNAQVPPQPYAGALNTVGIDIGISAGGVARLGRPLSNCRHTLRRARR